MALKEALKKIVPNSVKNFIRPSENRENKKLYSLDRIHCNTSKLLPKSKVNLAEIFTSEKTHSSWAESKKELDALNIPDLTGGVNPGDRRAIYYIVRYFKPQSVLEVGTHIGASTVHVAAALHKNQVESKMPSKLLSLDIRDVNSLSEKPWLQYGSQKSPSEMIKVLKHEDFVSFTTDTSFDFLATGKDKYDFIFLDGEHSATTVYREIPLALKNLNNNGVILLHDYFPNGKALWSNKSVLPGPYLATGRHIGDGADISIIPLGDLPWSTKLGSNRTSLALLVRND